MKNASIFRKNRQTIESPHGRKLFTPGNYLFSTKAEGRKETLYFRNRATKQTGRLRQQHTNGPRAQIDEMPRTHLFLSGKRYEYLRRWHARKGNEHRIPKVGPYERQRTEEKKHIEFAYMGKRILKWHHSKGIVKIRKNTKRLVQAALDKVCGK